MAANVIQIFRDKTKKLNLKHLNIQQVVKKVESVHKFLCPFNRTKK